MPRSRRADLVAAFAFLLLAAGARPVAAQAVTPLPDRWQLTFNDQHYVWEVRLVRLAGDTLIVRGRDSLIEAPVGNLAEIRLLPESILLVGDGHHSAVSALAGNNPGVFDMSRLDPTGRKATIQKLLALEATVIPGLT